MAIGAKVSFMKQLEKALSAMITVSDMNKLMTAVADVSENFDMQEISVEEEHDDLIECFLQAIAVQGRSQKTIATYKGVIKRLMQEIRVTVRRVTVYHLRSYLAKLKEKGLKESTMEGYRQVFSSFFGWLFREGLIEKNPVVNLGSIKVPKVQKLIFSDIDMELMRQSCENVRDKAIICFLASTGCRVGELVGVNINAVDLKALECVVTGKGNKQRTVYLDNVTAMFLRNYLSTRKDDNEALFINRSGRRFKEDGIREMLLRIEKASGVHHVHPHKFRRTLATTMAKRGMPIQVIAQILGHEKIETTMKYISMNKDDVKLKYQQYYAV